MLMYSRMARDLPTPLSSCHLSLRWLPQAPEIILPEVFTTQSLVQIDLICFGAEAKCAIRVKLTRTGSNKEHAIDHGKIGWSL